MVMQIKLLVLCCYSLFVNGPVTGGTSKWEEGGVITLDVNIYFLFTSTMDL